jgi:hypothetical protein
MTFFVDVGEGLHISSTQIKYWCPAPGGGGAIVIGMETPVALGLDWVDPNVGTGTLRTERILRAELAEKYLAQLEAATAQQEGVIARQTAYR